jgi:hypothetical protein
MLSSLVIDDADLIQKRNGVAFFDWPYCSAMVYLGQQVVSSFASTFYHLN